MNGHTGFLQDSKLHSIVFCILLASCLVSACGSAQSSATPTKTLPPALLSTNTNTFIPSRTRTPASTPTLRPTYTISLSPTPSQTATIQTTGKALGITQDGKQIVLYDLDYQYAIVLPPGVIPFDPLEPIENVSIPADAEARFLSYSEATNSGYLVLCWHSQDTNIRTLANSLLHGDWPSSTIVTTDQGEEVSINFSASIDPAVFNYEVIYLVKGGYCDILSTVALGNPESFYDDYWTAVVEMATSIILLDQ